MLYSVMSTKFRRAFSRILSCKSNSWIEARTEITFATPYVSNIMKKKSGSSKMELMENKRRISSHSKSHTARNSFFSVCDRQNSTDIVTFQDDTDDKNSVRYIDKPC